MLGGGCGADGAAEDAVGAAASIPKIAWPEDLLVAGREIGSFLDALDVYGNFA